MAGESSSSRAEASDTTERPPGRVPGKPDDGGHTDVLRRLLMDTHGGEMVAEFFGTMILILLGCGADAVAIVGLPGSGRQTGNFGPADWLIIMWGWGLGVVFGVHACSRVSGGHINPAVTLAFAVRRQFPWRKVPGYWLAQLAGGIAGGALVYAAYAPAIDAYNQAHHLADRAQSLNTYAIFATFPAKYFHGAWAGPFIDQIIGTAILVALIAALLDRRNMAPLSNMAPFLIGLVVVAIGASFGTNAGYAINPARDLGPRLVAYIFGWGPIAFPGHFQYFDHYWWIPIAGPLVGAVIGILAYDILIGHSLRPRSADDDEE